jgi:hypothetical protein
MERWFLGGLVLGLLILLFDQPLANAILGNVTGQTLSNTASGASANNGASGTPGSAVPGVQKTKQCAGCSGSNPPQPIQPAKPPATPSSVVLAPSQSRQYGSVVQPVKSPAPMPVGINSSFAMF